MLVSDLYGEEEKQYRLRQLESALGRELADEDFVKRVEFVARIRRMARDFPAFLERFIYNDQCVMLD